MPLIHRFAIDPETPADVQHGSTRQVHHCWFFARLADLDGDGDLEQVYLRGTALHVAYRRDGTLLWRWRDPDASPSPYRSDSPMPILDIDGDGRVEVVCIRRFAGRCFLTVLDGATGAVKRVAPEPLTETGFWETHVSLVPAYLDGRDQPPGFLLHHDYFGITAFGPDLRQRWHRAIPELGHTTVAADLDGDGRDELYTGTRLFDADGTPRWERPELLEGTGETHPDSNPVAHRADGSPLCVFGPGARLLDPTDGSVVRQLDHQGFREVQSVRVLRGPGGDRLALTDHPETGGPLTWRGMPIRNVRSQTLFSDLDGNRLALVEGMHTPQTVDWDGDGTEELAYLDASGARLLILRSDGERLADIPVQHRAYISDLAVGRLRAGDAGEGIILHEWSDDFASATAVELRAEHALGRPRRRDQLELARYTTY